MKNLLKITLITAAMAVASVSQATTVRGNAACWGITTGRTFPVRP
jgi:hypothetical protein